MLTLELRYVLWQLYFCYSVLLSSDFWKNPDCILPDTPDLLGHVIGELDALECRWALECGAKKCGKRNDTYTISSKG